MGKTIPVEERFWAKVDKRGPDDCWEWKASRFPSGYGLIEINGRSRGAHRVSFELANGSFNGDLNVCHRCDNKPCVNPSHLFLGTQQQNIDDMHAKGRANRGDVHHSAKMTQALADNARKRVAGGETMTAVAKDCGVSLSTISHIVKNKIWITL